ncbi:MAG: hypothetical protein AB2693_20510 [Candidatus Thiodiazotropha sp.]
MKYATSIGLRTSEITIDNLPDLEKCFQVNVNVYNLQKNRVVKSVFKSREQYVKNSKPDTMNLNLFENHLSYIMRFHSYASKYQCNLCDRLFSRASKLHRHDKICDKVTSLKFSGGFYSAPKTIFEKLSEIGIEVEKPLQHYPWMIVYDMESLLLDKSNEGTMWKTEHRPVSVCINSNVSEFENVKFILDSDDDKLLQQMIEYMNTISDKAYELSKCRWKNVFDLFDKLEQKWNVDSSQSINERNIHADSLEDSCEESNVTEPPSENFVRAISKENVYYDLLKRVQTTDKIEPRYNDWTDVIETDDEDDDDDVLNDADANQEETDSLTRGLMMKLLRKYREEFEIYCKRIICIGYNSGKYDINLVRSKLPKYLGLHLKGGHKFVIKKNNNYTCIANDKLKFVDIMNYLPPGTSYDKFLQTFNIEQRKSYFPYEYLTDLSVLQETSLPPKTAFYSSLKQRNVLESDVFVKYCILVEEENKAIEEALQILNLNSPPLSQIDENYERLLQVWKEEKMNTMLDYLKFYNSLDVTPMLKGVEALKQFFISQNIDVFKDCISVPGVARKMLFQCAKKARGSFALIDKRDEDLYHKIKASLVGGPSIVTTRYHEVGQTYIREDKSKPTKSIFGYDYNSLYLYAIGHAMPTNNYIRRSKENNFIPENDLRRHTVMYDWMDWLNSTENMHIKHKMNNGNEIRIGPYLIDGYDPDTGDLYEFFGCYFHSHTCLHWKLNEKQKKKYENTLKKLAFLESKGYKVHYIWE